MPWIDISVAALLLAALIVGVATRRRRAVPVLIVGSATVLLLVIAFVLEGARLQLIAEAVAAVVVAVVVLWARSGRTPRLAVAGATLVALGVVGIAGAAWALPPMSVPTPSGPHAVGVATHVWTDPTRDAHGGSTPGQVRSLPVTVWYPAARPGPGSAYLPNAASAAALTGALAEQYGMPALLFDSLNRARSTATEKASPADGSFPVVIASPGFNSTRWFFTSWAEELASNGIVVIALDHPYDAAATELADGSIAYDDLRTTGDDAADQALADQWAGIRAADIRAVIDTLERPASDAPELAVADRTRIIAAGHSAGGAAAIEAARLDPRITGVVDIDGMPRSPADTRLAQPLLAVVAGDMPANPDYDRALSSLLADRNGARITLDGVAHLGMIDAGRLIGPVPGLTGANGPQGARLAAEATLLLMKAVDTRTPIDTRALGELGAVGE
ncbi:alpha/beta fold hydrolase [Leifsonia aquatica]|uniref:Dienelactone hydrolase n=4 Tax=Leifsonia aquatica TaxID=144185 RepID=A0A7W4YKQ6_LEIAQ|nr:dienelactone hydrolase [Leifsonia aquatica]